ncbi:MAG: hemerythrin family protein [Oligoflexia bacterium]|nr:hemerythrin family protein [Oligoflexia bacterium]
MDSLLAKYQIGLPLIDEQHARFMQIIEDAVKKISAQKNSKDIAVFDLVQDLKQYSTVHFLYEENQMKKHNWPELATHKQLHEIFKKKVLEFSTLINSSSLMNAGKPKELAIFLKEWFLNHIQRDDRKFAEFVQQKAITSRGV